MRTVSARSFPRKAKTICVMAGVVLLSLAQVAAASPARAPGTWVGRLAGPGDDGATSIATSPDGSKVFVTGGYESATKGQDYLTAVYDASTGARLWIKAYNGPANGGDNAYSVATSPDGSKIFVTGGSDGTTTGTDYATVAYDASTGAQLWATRYNGPGNDGDVGASVATAGSVVFVTGLSAGTTTGMDYATVAYDASTGAQLWVMRYNGPANGDEEPASVVAAGSKVFVTGGSPGTTTGLDYATLGYDASTGAQLWVVRYDGPTNQNDLARSIAASPDGSRLFVTGLTAGAVSGQSDYATVAYDASAGAQLWVKGFQGPGAGMGPAHVAASPNGARVFLTCGSLGTTTGTDYATVAYVASTGVRLWVARYNGPANGDDGPSSIVAGGSRVFVTGGSPGTTSDMDYATVVYAASTGARLAVARYNGPANGYDMADAAATTSDGSKVFVTGWSEGSGGAGDFATVGYGG